MDDNNTQLLSELVKTISQIQAELRQMNSTLSAIASQGKGSAGSDTRYPSNRPTGAAGRIAARTPRFKRADDGESTDNGNDQGFRPLRKKSPARPKGKLPAKKGGGYPKKPR